MPKPPLTPQEKAAKQARSGLALLTNQVRNTWSFGQLKVWRDVYTRLGYDNRYIKSNFTEEQCAKELTYPELKEFLSGLERSLEETLATKAAEPTRNTTPTPLTISQAFSQGTLPKSPVAQVKNDKTEQTPPTSIVPASTINATEVLLNYSEKNNYGLCLSPKEKAFLYWFQKKAAAELLYKITVLKLSGILLLSSTGTGKTFIMAAVLRRLADMAWEEGKTLSHIPYLVLTKTTVVQQTARVFFNLFDLHVPTDIEVINIEKLRSNHGKFWIKEKVVIEDGEEVTKVWWKNQIQPPIIFLDESQGVKNVTSKQSQLCAAYTELEENATLVCVSATPFTRVCEAKVWAISTHRPLGPRYGLPEGTVLNSANWATYAAYIASDGNGKGKPEDYNQAAIERLMDDLKDYVVRVKGVKMQFKGINTVEIVHFRTPEERKFYETAMDRYEERVRRAEAELKEGKEPSTHPFTIFQQLLMAAELCKAELIADRMYKDVQGGFAACAAVKYKCTLIAIEQFLENKYGVKRDNITLVWGGGQTQLNAKQKTKKKILSMQEQIEATGMEMAELMEDADLDQVEDRELLNLPKSSRLGMQSIAQRQVEIDGYQSGKRLYCIYTFKAGGVGLSLPHCDELTTDWNHSHPKFNEWYAARIAAKDLPQPGKVRRKESGYAVEEDIPFIPTRPRKNTVATTVNAIELVQGVGRIPRIVSLSDSLQSLIFYFGTIEVRSASIAECKLRCLTSVVQLKEDWQDFIRGNKTEAQLKQYLERDMPQDEAGTLIDEGEEGGDE